MAPSGRKEETEAARTLLGCLKFTPEEMEHPVLRLSGGQRSKLLLLWLTYSGANVLLLDEPTRSLSPLTGPVVREMLAAFPGAIRARLPRPAVPGAGVYRRLSAGAAGPAAAAAGTAAELNTRRERR